MLIANPDDLVQSTLWTTRTCQTTVIGALFKCLESYLILKTNNIYIYSKS